MKGSPEPLARPMSPAELDRLTAMGWDVWNRQGEAQTLGAGNGRVWSFSIMHKPIPSLRVIAQGTEQQVTQVALAVPSPDPVRAAILYLDDVAPVPGAAEAEPDEPPIPEAKRSAR
jgi:hypothetical protein